MQWDKLRKIPSYGLRKREGNPMLMRENSNNTTGTGLAPFTKIYFESQRAKFWSKDFDYAKLRDGKKNGKRYILPSRKPNDFLGKMYIYRFTGNAPPSARALSHVL